MNLKKFLMHMSLGVMFVAHICRYVVSLATGNKGKVAGVRVIIVRNNEVLLLNHWYAPFVWTLPGGGIDKNETPEQAGIREVKEETGLVVNAIGGEVGTYKGKLGKGDNVTVLYSGDFLGNLTLHPNLEIMTRSWFKMDTLPEELSPASRRRIEAFCNGKRNEESNW